MSATPAWLPGYAPLFMEAASSYRYRVRRFSMYCADPSDEVAWTSPEFAQ